MAKVLIVETDDAAMRLLAWGLRERGVDVATVAGPEAATEAMRPSAVIINTQMAPEEKRLWIASIRMLLPAVFVIDLTAEDQRRESGADAYVPHQARVEEIHKLIEGLPSSEAPCQREG